MRVLIDISTPKEVLFFKEFILEFQRRGCMVKVITREYGECNALLKHFKIEAAVLGRHGGATLKGKLEASTERVSLITNFLEKYQPHILVNYCNPESSRAAYGLNIPIATSSDIPEAWQVSKLTIPLATLLFSTTIIPKSDWVKYGISENQIIQYPALDAVLWLKHHIVTEKVLEELNLTKDKPIIVYRPSETQAAYLLGEPDIARQAVEKFKQVGQALIPEPQYVEVPRYTSHKIFDLQSLLALADVFIGGGGTINVEVAYYGTQVINCRTKRTRYLDFLVEKGLAYNAETIEEAVHLIGTLLRKGKNVEAVKEVFNPMVFPLKEIVNKILSLAK